jgi:hypothetical protein
VAVELALGLSIHTTGLITVAQVLAVLAAVTAVIMLAVVALEFLLLGGRLAVITQVVLAVQAVVVAVDGCSIAMAELAEPVVSFFTTNT